MSENTLNVRLRSAVKTDAEWKTSNPVLLKGEAVYSSDKKLYKIGDGTSTWSELSYNSAETLVGLGVSVDELNYVKGVTSNIQEQLDSKAEGEHTHPLATTSQDGLLSSTDKKRIENLIGSYSLGNFSGKTATDLKTALDTWLDTCLGLANASAYFTAAPDWITAWNSGDATKKISAGARWTVTVVAPYGLNTHVQLRISCYSDKSVVYVCKGGNAWGVVYQAAFKDDITDRSVLQSVTGATNYRPLVMGAKYDSDTSKLADTVTDQVYTSTTMYAQPSTGTIFATKFKGALEGNATSATSATAASYLAVSSTFDPTNVAVDTCKLKVYDSYNVADTPTTYGNVLEINGIANHWKPQLWFDGTNSGSKIRYRYRGYNTTAFSGWKVIAFTDSDITGNAATATKLKTARTIQVNLASTSSASFDGSENITPGVTGILAVGNGGTGLATLTSGYALIGNGTKAVSLRAITNNTTVNNSGWTSSNGTNLITANTLAYWNGQYASGSSNLAYCIKGAFGDAVTKGVDTTPTSESTNLITSGAVYTGLAGKSNTNHNHNNVYVYDKAKCNGTMNDAASFGNSMGMINVSAPSDGTASYVNPNSQTGWHHFINISYELASTNMWQTQIANKAGTTNLWVRSRKGGTISNSTAWDAPWALILTSSNYSSYALPLTGGTMKGRIQAPTLGVSYLGGMTISNATLGLTTQNSSANYHPIIAGKTLAGNFWNLGTIHDLVGFHGYFSTRTTNGIDWSTVWDVKTGNMTCSGTITAPKFSGTATNLQDFTTTKTTAYDASALTTNGIVYTSTDLLGQTDGALYQQYYSDKWIHQMFGDYRTGQMALRGKNNGTWQAWRTVLDSVNYKTYCTATNLGFTTASRTSASPAAAAGWFRIATSANHIANCTGIFKITGVVSGYHTAAIITAGTSYGVGANVQVLQCAHYLNAAITKVRIVYHTTYNNNYAYLEVYKPATGAATPISVSLIEGSGWTLVAPSTAGSIPSGYVNKEVTLTSNTMSAETFVGALSGNATSASTWAITTTNPTASTEYYIPFTTGVSGNNGGRANNGIRYISLEGTTSANGYGILRLGNGSATGTAGNKYGRLELLGTGVYYVALTSGTPTAHRVITLPDANGTIALTSSSITGNAATATKWKTARTLSLTGAVTGSASIDGSGNVSLATTVNHTHTYIESLGNYTFTSSTLPNSFSYGLSLGFVNADAGFGSYGTVITARSYTGGGGSLQLYAPYSATYGGTHIKARFGDYATSSGNSWTSLKEIAWTEDITSYAAPISGSLNYVRVYNSGNVNNNSSLTFNDLAKQHCAVGMIYSSTDNPTGAAKWCHGISLAWGNGSNANWVSQIALGTEDSNGMWYRTTQGTIVGAAWKRVLDSSNYSSYALPKTGGTMSGTISSSLTTGTHIAGNKGTAIINSTYAGSGYNMLAKMNSTNGVFCLGQYQQAMRIYYTKNDVINAGTNTFNYQAVLLNESGNSSFPGTVSATTFSGNYSGGAVTGHTYFNNNVNIYWKNRYNVNCSMVALEGTTMYFGYGHSYDLRVGEIANTSQIQLLAKNAIYLKRDGGVGAQLYKESTTGTTCFAPTSNASTYLGCASYRWNLIYTTKAVSVSSDRRIKNTIQDIDDKYLTLCEYLSPKSYYLNDATEKKREIGFVAQEVEEAAEKAGLNINDCGFIHKNYVNRDDYQGVEYGLSYDAFGVLAIAKIKQQDQMIKELRSEIEELRNLIT